MKRLLLVALLFVSAALAQGQVTHLGGGGGSGTVTTSGSPASPQLSKFSAATEITSATATDVSTPSQCADAGASDTYACNLAPAIASYVVGTKLRFFANTANTGAATVNFNSVGALTLVKVPGGITTALATGDICAGQWVEGTIATGSNFQITSQLCAAAGGIGGSTGSTDNAVLRADGTGGATLQNSAASIDDSGNFIAGGDGSAGNNAYSGTSPTHVNSGMSFCGGGYYPCFAVNGSQYLFVGNGNYASGPQVTSVGGYSWSQDTGISNAFDTVMSRSAAGVVQFGTTALNASGSIKAATATFTTVAADTATADSTLCIRTSDGLLLKGTGTIGICLGTSSARYKHNVQNMDLGLARITKLRPRSFFYNTGYGDGGARRQLGFTAEEVVKVLPEVVGLDKDGKPNSVDLLAMVPVLTNAIQELNAKVDRLTEQVRAQKHVIRKLRSRQD